MYYCRKDYEEYVIALARLDALFFKVENKLKEIYAGNTITKKDMLYPFFNPYEPDCDMIPSDTTMKSYLQKFEDVYLHSFPVSALGEVFDERYGAITKENNISDVYDFYFAHLRDEKIVTVENLSADNYLPWKNTWLSYNIPFHELPLFSAVVVSLAKNKKVDNSLQTLLLQLVNQIKNTIENNRPILEVNQVTNHTYEIDETFMDFYNVSMLYRICNISAINVKKAISEDHRLVPNAYSSILFFLYNNFLKKQFSKESKSKLLDYLKEIEKQCIGNPRSFLSGYIIDICFRGLKELYDKLPFAPPEGVEIATNSNSKPEDKEDTDKINNELDDFFKSSIAMLNDHMQLALSTLMEEMGRDTYEFNKDFNEIRKTITKSPLYDPDIFTFFRLQELI